MPPHIGGIELVAASLFRAYRAAGLETRWVAAREPSSAPAREDGRIRVGCWNGFERRLGVPWPIFGVEGIRELARLVRWADLVHVHDCLYAASGAATLLARRARKPVILSQHIGFVNYPFAILNGVEHLANHTLSRAVLRSASHVVFCTKAAEQFAGPFLKGPPRKTSFIPNGVDTDRFKPPTQVERAEARDKLKLPAQARVALFVGRLVEKKGVDVLAELIRRTPSHVFIVVGDGPLKTKIPADAVNVAWFPAVVPDLMPGMHRAADVFLLPSHGEGLPLSVQEAMATGLPVIVSADEAFTAMLDDEKTCLASERTPAAFQRSLETLAHDPELTAGLAARSRELAVRNWSLGAMTSRYTALIREMMGAN